MYEKCFGIESNLALKVANGWWRIYEVDISYSECTYDEFKDRPIGCTSRNLTYAEIPLRTGCTYNQYSAAIKFGINLFNF